MTEEITPGEEIGNDPRQVGEKLREMVEAEAAAAEAETPADEPDPDNPDDEETVGNRAIIEALGNYLGVVQSVMGEDAPITPCVFCQGFGFNSIELLADTHSHRCEDCGGHGRVHTGSLVPGNETRTCDSCRGTGFQTDSPVATIPQPETEPQVPHILSPAEVEQIAAQARANVGGQAA